MHNDGKINLRLIDMDPVSGCVQLSHLETLLNDNVAFVSVMFANNETGVIQPIREIGEAVRNCAKKYSRQRELFFHVDASQAIGKVNVNLAEFGADVITITARKFHGPQIGAVVICGEDVDKSVFTRWPLIRGGAQEMGRRSGTENIPMICGLGAAIELVRLNINQYASNMHKVRNYFESQLKVYQPSLFPNYQFQTAFNDKIVINFEKSPRLCNTSSVCFPHMPFTSQELLKRCTTFVASTGAACHSGNAKPSATLLACGMSEHCALRTVRFSIGRQTTEKEVDIVINELLQLLY
jgi:cysteine sulfinate desulfinase/cysteine desulfurase-like protein